MIKKKTFRIENIEHLFSLMDGAEKRQCHLLLKTFMFKHDLTYLEDLKELEHRSRLKKKGPFEMKSNPTRFYYKLLDCLYDIHFSEIEQDADLTKVVQRVKVLYHLGLHEDAERLAQKISKNSLTYSNIISLQEIFDLRIKNAIKRTNIHYLTNEYNEDRKLQQEFLRYKINLIDYQAIWAIVKSYSVTKHMTGSELNLSDEFKELLTSEDKALSSEAKIYFNMTKGYFAISAGDTEFALFHSLRCKKIYEADQRVLQWNPAGYLIAIKNICISYIFLKMGYRAAEEVKRIESIKETIPHGSTIEVQQELIDILVGIKMDLIIEKLIPIPSDIEIKSMEKYFRSLENKIAVNKVIAENFVFSVLYFKKNMMRESLKCLNHLLTIKSDLRKDLQQLARIVELCIYWTKGDLELFLSRLKSFETFVKHNKEDAFFFEKRLVINFKKMSENPYEKNFVKMMQEDLKEDLYIAKNDDYLNYLTPLFSNFNYGKEK